MEHTSLSDDPLADEDATRSASAAVLDDTRNVLKSGAGAPLARFDADDADDMSPACGSWNSL